ncbi:MAG: capsular biosynthesis protein [Bermanella sp.]
MAVLLLQGPLGPFFNHLAYALIKQGQAVYKINFNGGDEYFYSQKNVVNFSASIEQWPDFFLKFVRQKGISSVLVYGDCRRYHHAAKQLCCLEKIKYFAFEEGYLRPNYITFEREGVNGYSPITHAEVQSYLPVHEVADENKMPANFLRRAAYAASYYILAFFKRVNYPEYIHHRSFSPVYEALCWFRSFYRKGLYRLIQKDAKQVCRQGDFFLVPLQVHNDAQIEFHSQYDAMQDFIIDVLTSFARSGCGKKLVFKHHPMDRGHVHYGGLIKKQAGRLGIANQVSYIHDQHLPTLLKSCEGVVTINSTTALQAFYHGAPVLVMGYAFFDMPGLTHQGSVLSFWQKPESSAVEFPDRFRAYILQHGQINGSFYIEPELTTSNLISYLFKIGVLTPSKAPLKTYA